MKTILGWRTVCDPILALAWAPRCAVCDDVLAEPTQGVVCPDCWRRIELSTPPVCESCGATRAGLGHARGEERDLRCRACREPRGQIRRRAAGPYDGVLRLLVHALKYGGRRSLAVPLGNLLRRAGHCSRTRTTWYRSPSTRSVGGLGGSIRRPISPGKSDSRSPRRCIADGPPCHKPV